jgi:vitamin B12 transporter
VPEWGTKFRSSIGTGGKAPALDQLYNPFYGNANLKAERSTGIDAGIDQSLFGGRANVSVTAFYNRYSSLIQYTYTGCAPAQMFGCYFNIGRAETKGIEVAGDAVLVEGVLKVRGGYTWLNARDRDTGFRLLRRPEHAGNLALVWTPDDRWTIEPSVRMVGSRYSGRNFATGAPTEKLSPYARFDLRADYKLHKNLNLYLRAENLTNARYSEVYNYGTTGRAFYAGARATW